jgi:hypothetical protein
MLLIREVFHCKPGKVRPLVEKFLTMSKLNEKMGLGKMKGHDRLQRRKLLDARFRVGSREP